MRRTSLHSPVFPVGLALLTTLAAAQAHARRNGTPVEGCNGCHTGGAAPSITIDVSPKNPAAGETVTLQVAIAGTNASVGGLYLLTGKGKLATIAGQGTKLLDDHQLVHDAPKRASGGVVRFDARWTAPPTPGGVLFKVWAIAGNGDNGSRGDGAASTTAALAYGCAGETYYLDRDGDGHGDPGEPTIDCSPPPDHAVLGDDCDDYNVSIHPGAPEVCNGRDDNCNGEIDENLEVRTHYEDADGDGYGSFFGATVQAKCPPEGFAPNSTDCNDRDANVHPGAPEVCNLVDDDCDDRVDEGVREVCGVGMCAREAITCSPGSCTPGEPMPEICNGLDDDCDGEVDEDPGLCGPGGSGSASSGGTSGSSGAAGPGSSGSGAPEEEEGGGQSGGCAIDPEGGSPWPLLPLLSPLAFLALRRLRPEIKRLGKH
ncbi:putative metal-binding motif-containing protein [Sorangium sp. So ce1024]|uniref:putative metal-binding motif-containing protein n=1 Tax=Sorangium sp. So ce1024 TaxID=3133327 RepID=UPI003F09C823